VTIENKLSQMGIELPDIAENYKNNTSGAKYVSHYSVGTVLYLSGCTPMKDGKPYMTGILGDDLSVEQGYEAARQCMVCYLGAIKYALGDLGRVARMLHLVGYVNSADAFTEQPRVINGAVDILVDIFGRSVMPTRAAIGCRGLASNHSVELIATIEFDGGKVSDPIARDGEPLD